MLIPEKYLERVGNFVANKSFVSNPKRGSELFDVYWHKGKIVGWAADERRVSFSKDVATITYSEMGYRNKSTGEFEFGESKYHFQPNQQPALFPFRIERDAQGTHANPSDECRGLMDLPHRIESHPTPLLIDCFNLLSAMSVAWAYIRSGDYPLQPGNEAHYNGVIQGCLRSIGYERDIG